MVGFRDVGLNALAEGKEVILDRTANDLVRKTMNLDPDYTRKYIAATSAKNIKIGEEAGDALFTGGLKGEKKFEGEKNTVEEMMKYVDLLNQLDTPILEHAKHVTPAARKYLDDMIAASPKAFKQAQKAMTISQEPIDLKDPAFASFDVEKKTPPRPLAMDPIIKKLCLLYTSPSPRD